MIGAVQLGVMAACVVLFVPMGMAGWHLSRNKVLFFSGALFITLAVGVHVSPYFPSISDFVYPVSSYPSSSSSENRRPCLSLLHDIVWDLHPITVFQPSVPHSNTNGNTSGSYSYYRKSWSWARSGPVVACNFQTLGPSDASDLLNGSWVVVAGDSQERLLAVSLLGLVLDSERMESIKDDLFKRHSDYGIVVAEIGLKFDFFWAPFVTNLTDLMIGFKQKLTYPDVLVMGSGLWHMLHISNATDYGDSLRLLRTHVMSSLAFSQESGSDGLVTGLTSFRSPHLFWLGMPILINSMLNTEEKREKMTDLALNAYNMELHKSNVLQQSGGPFLLLDIHSLTQGCGSQCTEDGMHYDKAVYSSAVHIMLNALLIESHQKLE